MRVGFFILFIHVIFSKEILVTLRMFNQVVKKSGMIIDPIKFEEVDPHDKEEQKAQGGRKRRTKSKSSGKKSKHGNPTVR